MTALALRVAELRRRYSEALISSDIGDRFPGPDLICWNAHPEEIWIWQFDSDDAEGVSQARASLDEILTAPGELTAIINKRVVAGPNSVFSADPVNVASPGDSYERVEVRHGPVDGIQLYREIRPGGKVGEGGFLSMLDAFYITDDAEEDAREALGFHCDDERTGSPAGSNDGGVATQVAKAVTRPGHPRTWADPLSSAE